MVSSRVRLRVSETGQSRSETAESMRLSDAR